MVYDTRFRIYDIGQGEEVATNEVRTHMSEDVQDPALSKEGVGVWVPRRKSFTT